MITAILILMGFGVAIGLFLLVMSSGRKANGRHNQAPITAVRTQQNSGKGPRAT